MNVTCKDSFIGLNLTAGNEYTVLDVLGVFYIIKGDDGVIKGYPRSYFEKKQKGMERLMLEAPDMSADEFDGWLEQLPFDDLEEILKATERISQKAENLMVKNNWK